MAWGVILRVSGYRVCVFCWWLLDYAAVALWFCWKNASPEIGDVHDMGLAWVI